jgi:Protein NO VEIN, C-terminal
MTGINNKHKNYEILNLIGYGLAKFDLNFIRDFGFQTKTQFYNYIIKNGIAETIGTVKNRQDLFDPFFENKRKGWWQKGNAYIHRKILIDSLFGNLNASEFTLVVKQFIKEKYNIKNLEVNKISPIFKSRFKQLQATGLEAEEYFIKNFASIDKFREGLLQDARMYGDGYDFQIDVKDKYFLAEIKGIKTTRGGIRLTEKEYKTALDYMDNFVLIVVSNLIREPKMVFFFNPTSLFDFEKKVNPLTQINYHIGIRQW